jgi:hypothetical protein
LDTHAPLRDVAHDTSQADVRFPGLRPEEEHVVASGRGAARDVPPFEGCGDDELGGSRIQGPLQSDARDRERGAARIEPALLLLDVELEERGVTRPLPAGGERSVAKDEQDAAEIDDVVGLHVHGGARFEREATSARAVRTSQVFDAWRLAEMQGHVLARHRRMIDANVRSARPPHDDATARGESELRRLLVAHDP